MADVDTTVDSDAIKRIKARRKGYWTGINQPSEPEYVPMVHVYVFHCEGRSKVGITLDVEKRRRDLAFQCPFPLRKTFSCKVFAHVAGDIEHAAHLALAAHHTHGEWFACAAEVATAALQRAIKLHGRKPAPEGWLLPPSGVPGPRLAAIREYQVSLLDYRLR